VIIFQLKQWAIEMKILKFFIVVLLLIHQLNAQKIVRVVPTVSGFVQPIYKVETSNNKIPANEFLINRFRLGISGKYSDWTEAEIEIDPLDKNLVKDAFINFAPFQNISLSIGRQKIPFSRERLTSFKNIQYFERPKFVKEFDGLAYAGRDIGLVANFNTKIEKINVNLSAGIFNGNKGDLNGDYNNSKTFAQRLEIKHRDFSFGFNSAQKFDSLSSKYFVANGFDFEIEVIKNLKLSSEFLIGKKNSNTLTGGEFIALEYALNDFLFGTRFSQYFSNINKNAINYYEAKIDYKPDRTIKISFNWLVENKGSNYFNTIIIGASYVF